MVYYRHFENYLNMTDYQLVLKKMNPLKTNTTEIFLSFFHLKLSADSFMHDQTAFRSNVRHYQIYLKCFYLIFQNYKFLKVMLNRTKKLWTTENNKNNDNSLFRYLDQNCNYFVTTWSILLRFFNNNKNLGKWSSRILQNFIC